MRACAYCKTRYQKGNGITFHKFPTKKLWLKNIKNYEWSPKTNDVLCSKHFTDDCFTIHAARTALKPGSVPTLFSETTSSARHDTLLAPTPCGSVTTVEVKRKLSTIHLDNNNANLDEPIKSETQKTCKTEPEVCDNYEHEHRFEDTLFRDPSEVCENIKHDHSYGNSPRSTEKVLQRVKNALKISRSNVKVLSQRVNRLKMSVTTLKTLSKHSQSLADGGELTVCAGEGSSSRGGEDACVMCGGAVGELGRSVSGSSTKLFIPAAIFPRELNEKTLLCNDCYKRYCRKRKQQGRKFSHSIETSHRVALSEKSTNANVSVPSVSDVPASPQSTISLPNYKRVACRSERCLFPRCAKKILHVIPQYVKKCILRDYKLYTPEDSRVCREHLFSKDWKSLLKNAESDFTAQQIEDVISTLMTDLTAFNFDNIEDIPPNLLLYCTGMGHGQLHKILDQVPSLTRKTKTPVLALTAYLTKLRTSDSFDRMSTLFQTRTQILENITAVAKDCMLEEFFPLNLRIPSSCSTQIASGEIAADDPLLRYLQDRYYENVETSNEPSSTHTRLKPLASSKQRRCRKRKNSSDSDDDTLASKVKARNRLIENRVDANKSIKEECEPLVASVVGVEFEGPQGAEARGVSQSSEDDDGPGRPRAKHELDEEGGAGDEEETADLVDQVLVYMPILTEYLLADPLNTVPAPFLEMKSERDSVTVKEEPGEGNQQPSTTGSPDSDT